MINFDPTTHTYTDDRGVVIPSVTEVISGVGLINFQGIDPQILRQAAAFGTAVHQACALDDLGDLDESTLDENLKPYLDAWRTFRGAMRFIAIEQPLCHPVYGFAGTPDRISGNTIIDIKTSVGPIAPWCHLQTAGYSILADIPNAKRLIVQLTGNEKYKVFESNDRNDRKIFLCCLSVYQWKIKNS